MSKFKIDMDALQRLETRGLQELDEQIERTRQREIEQKRRDEEEAKRKRARKKRRSSTSSS